MQERLQKLIAAAGITSRRKAEELIVAGAVTVNGRIVTELGAKADPETDYIKVNGKLINQQLSGKQKIYLLLNKPVGYLSSTADPQQRPLVIDLVGRYRDRVHPVGRLDFNSEGLLLLTNDGEFHNLITGAASRVPKHYLVKVKGKPGTEQIERLRRGVTIDGHRSVPASLELLEESETNAWFEVVLYEGRNQQIRKMFDVIGHSVIRLRRTAIGFLRDTGLKSGEYRELAPEEIERFFRDAARRKKRGKEKTARDAKGRAGNAGHKSRRRATSD
ncbi:MAG TPA: pseudouridine synthase [Blastocatellia bacterium]|nr:pseudouridine synthase [Blastocatellia bacterium]